MSVGGNPYHRGPISAPSKKNQPASIYDELASSADKLVEDSKLYRSQFIDKIYTPIVSTVKDKTNRTIDDVKQTITNNVTKTQQTNKQIHDNTTLDDLHNNKMIEQNRKHIRSVSTIDENIDENSMTPDQIESERSKRQIMIRSKL